MICIHHNDLDGKCAAAIVAKKFRKVNERLIFLEMDYKDRLPVEEIDSSEEVIIVDFSLVPDSMAILRDGRKVTWIDHHATAKNYPYQDLPGLRNFEDKGDSGCELTWKYFFPNSPVPLTVQLIGDYDKWALKMHDSKIFYEGMKLLPNDPTSTIWIDLLADNPSDVEAVIKAGKTATTYRDNYCAGVRKSFGYETEIGGHKAYATNIYMFGSGGFGEKFREYPLCLAYIHDGKRFTVSLYSEKVDVAVIAKDHGGGGHKGAAGFVCDTLPFLRS